MNHHKKRNKLFKITLTSKVSINKNISDQLTEVTGVKLWICLSQIGSPFVRPLKHEDVLMIEIISQSY